MRTLDSTCKKLLLVPVMVLGASCAGAPADQQAATETETAATATGSAAAATSSADLIERGRYLVTIQDCNGCHTPFTPQGEPDMTRMLSGHPAGETVTAGRPAQGQWLVSISNTNTAWSGPWGVSFTTNLTPDRVTGIGGWSEQNFIDAIRKGQKSGAGRPLLPPMPWRMYAQATDEDLRAIYAYLMSIPAISNRVPNALPPRAGGN